MAPPSEGRLLRCRTAGARRVRNAGRDPSTGQAPSPDIGAIRFAMRFSLIEAAAQSPAPADPAQDTRIARQNANLRRPYREGLKSAAMDKEPPFGRGFSHQADVLLWTVFGACPGVSSPQGPLAGDQREQGTSPAAGAGSSCRHRSLGPIIYNP